MRIGTYNIRYDNSGDGDWGWKNRKETVIKQIHHMDADIFGTVEVLSHQKKDLLASLSSTYGSTGVARGDGIDEGEYNLIFYRLDKFNLLDSGHQWISLTPDVPSIHPEAGSKRVIVWGVLEDKETKEKILAIVTHLDNVSKTARELGSSQIKELLQQDKFKGLPVAVVGDFNFYNEDQAYKDITAFLKDSTLDDENLSIVPHTFQDDSEFVPHNPKRFTQLDYIFINDKLKTLGVTCGKDIAENGRYPSDHFPVWGQYQIV